MGKKEVTRSEKYEDYRNSIEESLIPDEVNIVEKANAEVKDTKSQKVKPLVLEWLKNKRKRLFLYYFCVSLFAIITIIVLVYFGVKIYG